MLAEVIREVHDASRQTHGARSVYAELVLGRQITVARCTVELVMRRLGLAGLPERAKFRGIPNTPETTALVTRDAQPERVRAPPRRPHRPRSSKRTARNPGHTGVCIKPSAIHSSALG